MKRLATWFGFLFAGLLLLVAYEALEHPESRAPVTAPVPVANIRTNAVAKSLNAVPGAIVCRDLETVSTLFHLYSAHWEDVTRDQTTNGASRPINGEPIPAPDPALYNCHLLAPGTPVRVENADAFTTGFPVVTVQLPDGNVIRGVTLPSMLSASQTQQRVP